MRLIKYPILTAAVVFAPVLVQPKMASAQIVKNPLCVAETAIYAPGHAQDIVVPSGFRVSVFASGLNMPTGIAFLGNKSNFKVYVLESGHGVPSRCNDQTKIGSGNFDPTNPLTPDVLVFDRFGNKIGGPLFKPTASGGGFQPAGPAVDIAFENGFAGGRLFATDSNQSTDTPGGNINSSRVVILDLATGTVKPFISGLPTGDHPSEQLAFKDGWVYWSQGSTTNSGVSDGEQPDIPCQPITLSKNVFPSTLNPDGSVAVATSGYSPFKVQQPGMNIPAFFNGSNNQIRTGVCDGATLRARLNNPNVIQAYGWGHRNGYAIRFAPDDHPLAGQLLVGEDGPDERGARPSNGAPEVLSLDYQDPSGTPVYHGWPDRFGFLASSQAVFNPTGGPSDALCVFDPTNGPSFCTPASLANILKFDVPIADVLAFPPAPIVAPVALEAADSSFTGIDFAPNSFVRDPLQPGAALYSLEGDFGFSPPNATAPAPEVGHEVKLINFNQDSNLPLQISFQNFARNNTGDQAFISTTNPAGFDRPTNLRFGPDECAYVVDYGAVRDPGGGPGGPTRFVDPLDGPLVQFPGTGTIFKICATQ